ncbi:MAG: antibiotic biosynthesis monooxygenase [Bacteroidetes bacterium]|nr:antibiotic biosynthesis monooxygenase [Bacteroidota bacterium]
MSSKVTNLEVSPARGDLEGALADTPQPPYYAVIFTSLRTEGDNGYAEMAAEMGELAKQQPGFLGVESAREELGITVSYWESLDAIRAWKANERHLVAQKTGREKWYKQYKTRICLVERDYGLKSGA